MPNQCKWSTIRNCWLIIPLFLLTGCITVGKAFPIAPLKGITLNNTNKYEIAERFGKPYRMGLSNGKLTWTYIHYRYELIGETYTKDLVFTFNHKGIIIGYDFNTSDPKEKESLSK